MAVVLIANTEGEVAGLFLTQRSVAHTWGAPQSFPSGSAPAPGVVVGPAQLGFFETGGTLHYTKGGADQGELATGVAADTFLDLTDTPGSYAGARGTLVQVNAAEGALEFFDGVKSNVIAHDGNDWLVVPVPVSDGQVLTADAAEGTGVKWATNGFSGVVPAPTLTGQVLFSADGSTYSLRNIGSEDDVLTVAGGVPVWSPSTGVAFPLLGTVESATAPDYSFVSDPDTGVGRGAANELSLIVAGVESLRALGTGVQVGEDGYSFLSEPSMSITRGLSNQMVLHVGLNDLLITNTNVGGGFGFPVWRHAAARSATVPTYSMSQQDPDTGLGSAGDDLVSLIAGGTETIRLGNNLIAFYSGVTPIARQTAPGAASGTDAAIIDAIVLVLKQIGIVV